MDRYRYINSNDFMMQVSNGIIKDIILKNIQNATKKPFELTITPKDLSGDPFMTSVFFDLYDRDMTFRTEIEVIYVDKNNEISYIINKIKEQHPQLFI